VLGRDQDADEALMAVRAPALAEGLDWLNSEPLAISDLRGRYILLDFFTFGCINCLNNLRTVKALHASYAKELCVIGIHTGKFAHEKELDALRAALRREDIEFAVVNDPEHLIADAYAAKGWPTTILIDNRGYIVHHASGEQKLSEWRGRFSSCGLQASMERAGQKERGKELAFPQKLLTAPEFLAVANTHGNEVWISGYDGTVSAVIEGLQRPMGMAFNGGKLYICESGAGRIVCYDIETQERETVVEELRNPYDIAVDMERLIVASAGSHQMLVFDRETLELKEAYGNRFEALRDGRAEECQLAQPSGVALMEDVLWFVDAESSSLRKIENGEVTTLIGEGLFTYGDSNEGEILLQHPQGLCAGIVNKVKAYYPDNNTMMTLLDGLDEPGGIAKKGCELYIANTNAHEIIVFDLSTMKKRVMTFR